MPAKGKSTKASSNGKYKATSWGQREYMCDLEVPSGQMCRTRRPGVTGLAKAGLLDSLDTLTVLVQTEHIDRVEPSAAGERRKETLEHVSEEGLRALLADPSKLAAAMDLMDRVVAYVVVEPPVRMPPENAEDREEGAIYTDMIDETDKIFIFSFAMGGTEDLATFREKRDATMAALSDVQSLESDAG